MVETIKIETDGRPVEIHRLDIKIPDLKGEPTPSPVRVLLAVDESQLWSLYIGVDRLKLVPTLQKATNKLAKELHSVGVKKYKWPKV